MTDTGIDWADLDDTHAAQGYEATDDSNARRLVDAHLHDLRHCPERGQWLVWAGHRWTWDPPSGGAVPEHARRVARELPAGDKDAARWRRDSLMARGLHAMTATARSDPRITAHIAALDARPYELCTPTGVLDLRTGALHPPDPAALHTRSTAVGPSPDPPTEWLRFLAATFAGDADATAYVQRLLGVSLLGCVREQLLAFCHGVGANGKSTLLGVVQRILGLGDAGYTVSAPSQLLTAGARAEHPTEVARLAGARLVVTAEIDDGQRFAEAKIKLLTGRDPLAARFMHRDYFTFLPSHTLWLLANHRPDVRTGGHAFWRRIKLVAFPHVVPEQLRDPELEDRLVAEEGPQILGWLVAGAVAYLAGGLQEPGSVTAATAAYQLDQDTTARFVAERCNTGEPSDVHLVTRAGLVYSAYQKWCAAEGETPVAAKPFATDLVARFGVILDRTMNARMMRGIAVDATAAGDDEPAEQGTWWPDDRRDTQ